jgi:hypothetical protein
LAVVSSALANRYSLDRFSAGQAGFTAALVNPEIILKITPTVYPINTRTLTLDTLPQNLPDAFPQALCLNSIQGAGNIQRMQPRHVQRFISIDIPQPGDKFLVEQQGLQLAVMVLETLVKDLRGESAVQGLRAEIARHSQRVRNQPYTPKFAGIVEG